MVIHNNALKTLIFNFLLLLCICSTAFSQRENDLGFQKELYDNLFAFPHWEIMVASNVTAKAQLIHFQDAKYKLITNPQISYEFGVHKITPINTRTGFILGLEFGLVGRNAAYIVPGDEIGLSYHEEYPFAGPISRERDIAYLAIPAEIEYRVFTRRKLMYLLNGGLSLRYAPVNNTSFADMDVMEVKIRGRKSPFVNVNVGGGIGILLNNHDLIKIEVKINYDPAYIAKGDFRLDTNSSSDVGIYKVRGNCLGLTFKYTRTKSLRN